MTSTASMEECDFGGPRRLPQAAWKLLNRWQQDSCQLIQDNVREYLANPFTMRLARAEPLTARAAVAAVPDPGLGIELWIGHPHPLLSIFAWPPNLVLHLVNEMLGSETEGWPADRPLTPLESSMVTILFQGIAQAIGEAWPGQDAIECRLGQTIDRPRRGRRYPPDESLISTQVILDTPCGEATCHWLLPQQQVGELLEEELSAIGDQHAAPDPQLLVLAERLPLELSVELGKTQLTMSEAAQLGVGDVLRLDQPVRKPLSARIGGTTRWLGFPCRVGTRRAFQLVEGIDSPNDTEPVTEVSE